MPTGKYERSPEHGRKISEALKGKRPSNLEALHAARRGADMPEIAGDRNGQWQGDAVGYSALHSWIRRHLGTPSRCEKCGTTDAARYEWANVSREYKRDRTDWVRLCVSCHRKDGYVNGEYEAWNAGLKVQTNTGRTHIKPGQHVSRETEFQPGMEPHNKYLTPRPCAGCGQPFQPKEASRKFCSRPCYWGRNRM